MSGAGTNQLAFFSTGPSLPTCGRPARPGRARCVEKHKPRAISRPCMADTDVSLLVVIGYEPLSLMPLSVLTRFYRVSLIHVYFPCPPTALHRENDGPSSDPTRIRP